MERLKEYRRKRDFRRTPEPAGGDADRPRPRRRAKAAAAERVEGAGTGAAGDLFVVQKHDAQRLHYDLRLEHEGVLRSWALPKGPSLRPGERRLAVEVEDHPLEYADFEGVIPKGEYGGGTVMLWDRGRWRATGRNDADRVDLELEGGKLQGAWTLTRMTGRAGEDGRNWLMIKRRDGARRDGAGRSGPPAELDDVSVLSGRSLAEIARDADRVWTAGGASSPESRPTTTPAAGDRTAEPPGDLPVPRGATAAALPADAPLQLARPQPKPPAGDDWIHEIKFDGYRVSARLDRGRVRLRTRNGHDWTERFPEIAVALRGLDATRALLDGEIVAFRADGVSSFGDLQEALATGRTRRLVYQAFDLLHLGEHDLRGAALIERKARLAHLLGRGALGAAALRYTDHVEGKGRAFFDRACRMGLEGIVSKRRASPYRGARSSAWLKVKCGRSDEFVVGGFTAPAGSRQHFGALLLGAFEGGELVYVGRVGTGFGDRTLAALEARLRPLERPDPPFRDRVPSSAGATWVEPRLVVDVAFTERTKDGRLRHPSFRGVREDKETHEIVLTDDDAAELPAAGGRGGRRLRRGEVEVAGVRLTNADRVLYPEQGVTKLELARYYERFAEQVLPWVEGRPLSLVRCPQGREGQCFFQKHPGESLAASIPRVEVREKSGTQPYVYVRSVQDLVGLVQVGVLELHVWGSRVEDLERPDLLVFDLDPDAAVPWSLTRATALDLRLRLDDLGLASFLRTTGGKGLHLVVPLVPDAGWDDAKAFARGVAEAHARTDPTTLTTTMSKAKRRGKVLIDYLRNGRGATAIASFSTRARPGAPVAVPIRWEELRGAMRSDRYDVRNLGRRLASLRSDPWEGFQQAARPLDRDLRYALKGAPRRGRRR